ncbi:hypothetical protein [Acinetobacter baumannii]
MDLVLVAILLAILLWALSNWYQDFKKWKYQKNKQRILNPWSDW